MSKQLFFFWHCSVDSNEDLCYCIIFFFSQFHCVLNTNLVLLCKWLGINGEFFFVHTPWLSGHRTQSGVIGSIHEKQAWRSSSTAFTQSLLRGRWSGCVTVMRQMDLYFQEEECERLALLLTLFSSNFIIIFVLFSSIVDWLSLKLWDFSPRRRNIYWSNLGWGCWEGWGRRGLNQTGGPPSSRLPRLSSANHASVVLALQAKPKLDFSGFGNYL